MLKILISVFGHTAVAMFLRRINRVVRMFSAGMHAIQYKVDWEMSHVPEWYDHYLDLSYGWTKNRNPLWVERGVFSSLVLKQGVNLLELCCGDGFNTYHFYSIKAHKIIAVDFDESALKHANIFNKAENIEFIFCDIRKEIPQGKFDNIIWDAAIEHFTPDEIDGIIKTIKKRLAVNGVLNGYTIVEKSDGTKSLSHHEYEFQSKEDLIRFLNPHFQNVKVFETIYPMRHNLYFYASDHVLPFDDTWEYMAVQKT